MILKTDNTRSVRKAGDYSKGCYSSPMAEYLEAVYVSDGTADEMTGDVDSYGGHLARVGKWTLHTDEQGFVTATKHTSEQLARASFQRWETDYLHSVDAADERENGPAWWVCEDCYFAHHYGARVHEGQWYAWESDRPCDQQPWRWLPEGADVSDWTDAERGLGLDDFSSKPCDACGTPLGGARFRMRVTVPLAQCIAWAEEDAAGRDAAPGFYVVEPTNADIMAGPFATREEAEADIEREASNRGFYVEEIAQ